eukprot:scaffold6785_cov166-Skeletonema_menzelii.AAC.8
MFSALGVISPFQEVNLTKPESCLSWHTDAPRGGPTQHRTRKQMLFKRTTMVHLINIGTSSADVVAAASCDHEKYLSLLT